MSKRDRASVNIDFLGIKPKFLNTIDVLRSEGFVDLYRKDI